jgi:hypothetical protein
MAYAVAIVVFGALLPGAVLGLLAVLIPESVNLVATLFTVPMLLILAPTLFASFYASYRDVFVAVDENA